MSRPENEEFKLALIRAYQPQQELKTTLFCMVTGVELPKENIVGAHIASHSKRTDMQSLLLIKNIDDVRNGVLWSQPIEMLMKILGSALPLTLQMVSNAYMFWTVLCLI